MRAHWSSENRKGAGLWAGRAWFYLLRHSVNVEWHFGRRARMCHLHLDLSKHGDHNIMWSISIPFLFAIYLSIDGLRWKRLPEKDRTIGASFNDGSLRLALWDTSNEWSRGQPWWWEMTVNVPDLIFGSAAYSSREVSTQEVNVAMPEGNYPAKVMMFESTWKRPRWPRPTVVLRADIEPVTPIPFPGKGENSWDMEDDAVHSMTCSVSTPEEAAQVLRKSILRSRHDNG